MKTLFDSLGEFFAQAAWPVEALGNQAGYGMRFTGEHGQWPCVAELNEAERTFVFYSACPIDAPPSRYPAVAELFNRLNYCLPSGNFELGYLDGDMRFRTSIEVPALELPPLLIDRVVYNNIATMGLYLPAIRAVVEQGIAPLDALSDALLV